MGSSAHPRPPTFRARHVSAAHKKPRHVHGYLLRHDDGWTLVDTGPRAPRLRRAARSDRVRARRPRGRPHRDHALPSRSRRRVRTGRGEQTGARVWQGALDYEQCAHVWGDPRAGRAASPRGSSTTACRGPLADELIQVGERAPSPSSASRPIRSTLREEGVLMAGWEIVAGASGPRGRASLPAARRLEILVSGRPPPLPDISPTVGLYPDGRPGPLWATTSRRSVARSSSRRAVAVPGARRADRRPRGACAGADRPSPRASGRADGGEDLGQGSRPDRLRRVAGAVRGRYGARSAPLRRRRDAFAPRAPRRGGTGGAARAMAAGRRLPILRASLDDPSSTQAPESGA